jgi:hypothetical protein
VSDESIERKINNSLLRVKERHLERIKELEQESAKLRDMLDGAMLILSELNNDFDSMEHSYVGKDSDYHKRIKAVLKWGSDE